MRKKGFDIVIFLINIILFLISLYLLWQMGIFCDEYNSSPSIVCGGEMGLMLYWIRLLFLFVLCCISGLRLFKYDNHVEE